MFFVRKLKKFTFMKYDTFRHPLMMMFKTPFVCLAVCAFHAHALDKPTVPSVCTPSNQGSCECGDGDVVTYVWWPGEHQRCIHTSNLDGGTDLPVLVSVSAYGQGMLGGGQVKGAREYGYAAIGVGSTQNDGAGKFGLEFPNDGVVNARRPTPCGAADSREHAYLSDLFDFVEGRAGLDPSRVYVEGFSQNSMFVAYVGVCFADRVAGIWQGGSGLAKTGHVPVVPGKQGQCRHSDFLAEGSKCCRSAFCADCTWWPVYPRTCGNKIVDCIAAYTNDGIACGTDWYMYEAMVAEGNDARLLSFSPSESVKGGHRNPQNQLDWIVGCLGVVDSCTDRCETSFLSCASGRSFGQCSKDLKRGDLADCPETCAYTLGMLNASETPTATLSRGQFGTRTGLPRGGSTAPRPNCEEVFGTFAETGYDKCATAAGPPAPAPIEACPGGPTEGPAKRPAEGPTGGPTKRPTEVPSEGPTERSTEGPTRSPVADARCLVQNEKDKFYLTTKKKTGKEVIRNCQWLEDQSEKKKKQICSKKVKRGTGDVTNPAQDVCTKSCDSCGPCYENEFSRFYTGTRKEGAPVFSTCRSLQKKKKKKAALCAVTETDVYGPARDVCLVTCGTLTC